MSDPFERRSVGKLVEGEQIRFRHDVWTVVNVALTPVQRRTEEPDDGRAREVSRWPEIEARWRIANAGGITGWSSDYSRNWVWLEIGHDGTIERFELLDTFYADILTRQHYPRCSSCGQTWPCSEESAYCAAIMQAAIRDRACYQCDAQLTGHSIRVDMGDGVIRQFHGAKKYRKCRKAAEVSAAEAGGLIEDIPNWGPRFVATEKTP